MLGFPAVTLRSSIERPEALDTGSITMTDLDPATVVAGVRFAMARGCVPGAARRLRGDQHQRAGGQLHPLDRRPAPVLGRAAVAVGCVVPAHLVAREPHPAPRLGFSRSPSRIQGDTVADLPLSLDSRIYVAGHNGLVGSAVWRRLRGRGVHRPRRLALGRGRPARPRRHLRRRAVRAARRGRAGRGEGRRDPGQLHLPRGLPQRQPAHPDQRVRGRPRRRRRAAAVPRLVVHLPQARAPADPRVRAAHRPARAHQRRLRDRQDRRDHRDQVLPRPVRPALDLGDADQPVRPGRQLRPRRPRTCCRR